MGENDHVRLEEGGGLASVLAAEAVHYLPGTIAAEAFDEHGLGGRDTWRPYDDGALTLGHHGDEGVHVAWLKSGEWLAYETEVDGAGVYELTARVAAAPAYGGGSFRVDCDGVDVGTVAFEPTDHWYDFRAVRIRVRLAAGERTLKIVAEEGGWSLDRLTIEGAA